MKMNARPFEVCRRDVCRLMVWLILAAVAQRGVAIAADGDSPDFVRDIAPLLQKHCTGCHNNDDRDGKLSLESFAELQKGGRRGPVVQPGEVASSRLLLLVNGRGEPAMPPEGSEPLTSSEIELLTAWIEAGAKGPDGAEPPRRELVVPKIEPAAHVARPIAAVAVSPDGRLVAVARYGEVELRDAATLNPVRTLTGFPGKVNDVVFSADGSRLIAASGISGLFGQASIRMVSDGNVVATLEGHRDAMFCVALSPDQKIIATAGYDRRIMLWDAETSSPLRTLEGHNGAVFDLAFSPDGGILASASADQTVKLWHVATGDRLDTLSQPLKEQYVVRFSPDGSRVAAAGLDKRIRVWQVVSRDKPQINPLLFARIAHEGAIIQLGFTPDGRRLVSIADDQTTRLWETTGYLPVATLAAQPDVTSALAMINDNSSFIVGRSDGSLERIAIPAGDADAAAVASTDSMKRTAIPDRPVTKLAEAEPNNAAENAQVVQLPAEITGTIHTAMAQDAAAGVGDSDSDADLFRFTARAGERWVFEVDAARSKSPLDSRLEVLSADGRPVPQVILQAVRDSYVTFRGIDSDTRDCRVHNWEEMDLNQYLYLNGEVVKLWLWPRGPDSGFQFYPERGKRITWFDTTPMSHALHEPCYIVQAYAPGTKLIPNGLPTFTLPFENDDDSLRQYGSDSRLHFTAPDDGEYLLRVTDARGFQGDNYSYKVTGRALQPDFSISIEGGNPTIPVGSGKEFKVVAARRDGFQGEIRVDVEGVPDGFHVTSPLVIQAGQTIAYGTIQATIGATAPEGDAAKTTRFTARAVIDDAQVTREAGTLGEIKLGEAPKILVAIGPDEHPDVPTLSLAGAASAVANAGDAATASKPAEAKPEDAGPGFGKPNALELTIAPGETITARVHILRNNFDGRIGFEAIEHNLPHGIIVDNVGLSGLLIREGESDRQFFLTAAPWVTEQTRIFHLRSKEEGGQTSWPIVLHVRRK